MRGTKCLAYEGGHRNACVISWPHEKLNSGRMEYQLTTQLDLLPTLMDMCEIENYKNIKFDGQSIFKIKGSQFRYHKIKSYTYLKHDKICN